MLQARLMKIKMKTIKKLDVFFKIRFFQDKSDFDFYNFFCFNV